MQLLLNATSPFSRHVLVTALELGLNDIDLIWIDPWESPEDLININPFSQVPAIKLENRTTLYDSTLICRYLFSRENKTTSDLTDIDFENINLLTGYALGKNLMEMAFRNVILERFYGKASSVLAERGTKALVRGMLKFRQIIADSSSIFHQYNTASLNMSVTLEYIRFRLSELFHDHVEIEAWLNRSQFKNSLDMTSPEKLSRCPRNLQELLSA